MDQTTLFGAAAAFSALAGTGLAVWSHVASTKGAAAQAAKDCHEQLLAARAEAEQLSAELHKLRMGHDQPG